MYNFYFKDLKKVEGIRELIKVFLKEDEFEITSVAEKPKLLEDDFFFKEEIEIGRKGTVSQNKLKYAVYKTLSKLTGKIPPWGIITGIRPVKLFGELVDIHGLKEAQRIFQDEYLLTEEKIKLVTEIYSGQTNTFEKPDDKSVGIYIGIPFCPTRCSYCSFTSIQAKAETIDKYLEALFLEIKEVGLLMKSKGMFAETLYIGGGTPTTLSAEQIAALLEELKKWGYLRKNVELTVEAGRPDTITKEKLQALKNGGCNRISINPQTAKEETLNLIGRNHKNYQINEAFAYAKDVGIYDINCDMICGLPKESPEDFKESLAWILKYEPTSITIHSLAAKRKSLMTKADQEFFREGTDTVENMLGYAYEELKKAEYRPYYMYRQKNMIGALENIGYSKRGYENLYNIRIMDEHQTIIAMGAGGISKVYFKDEDRLERVPNVIDHLVYVNRIDEMIDRKIKNIFKEV